MLKGLFCLLIAVTCVHLGGCGASKDDKSDIVQATKAYQAAIRACDGQTASTYVSNESVEYIGQLQRLALQAGPDEIQGKAFADRAFIAQIRHYLAPNYVSQLSPAQLLMVAVKDKWIGGFIGDVYEVDDFHIDGDRADAAITNMGKVPYRYRFVKENGVWKQDLTALFEGNTRLIENNVETKDEQNAFIMKSLEIQSRKKVSPDIWKKPKA